MPIASTRSIAIVLELTHARGAGVSRQRLAILYALPVRWMTRLTPITRQTVRMQQIVRAFLTAGLCVLLSGCSTPLTAKSGSPAPASVGSTTPAATTSRSSASKQYARVELFRVPMQPEDLAVTTAQIFVAQADGGPRPPDVTSTVFEGPLDGGAAPREISEARTPQGTGILGVAVAGDVLYISASANGPTGMFGIFRVANPPVAIAGGSSISANRPDNGDGGAATAAALHGPQGIAFTSTGDLFVAEAGDSRIRLIRSGVISTYAGTGACSTGSAAPGGPAKTTALCNPGLVAVGRNGVIYAAQRIGSNWIVSIDPAGAVTTIANDFPIAGLAVDTDGSLLAADARAGRIVRIDTTGLPNATSVVASSLGLIRGGLAVGTDGSIYFASSQTSSSTAADWSIFRLRPVP